MGTRITYYGVFNDGNFIEKSELEILSQIQGIRYILKHQYEQGGNYTREKYTTVDDKGLECFLEVGDYKCVDFLGFSSDDFSPIYQIYDSKRNTTNNIKGLKSSASPLTRRIIESLLPTIDLLNELGSFEAYLDHLRIKELEEENESLRAKVEELEKKIENISAPQ